MRKLIRRVGICFLLAVLVWVGTLIADRQRLHDELIRLHVVAASDSPEDQALKLRVRDAVMASLTEAMADIADVEQAKSYLEENIGKIEEVANFALESAGCKDRVSVSFLQEAFDTRNYDTFALPAGVYEAIRITIGDGEGENWWCVVFPTFCEGTASEDFVETASAAGFPESLNGALAGQEEYEIRFFLLDVLGKLENLLHKG